VALFSVAFLAVLREGVELALFLTAVNFSAAAVAVKRPSLAGWWHSGSDRGDRDRVVDV